MFLDRGSLSYLVSRTLDGGFSAGQNMEAYPSSAQDGHDFTDAMYQLFGGEQQRGLPVVQQAMVSLLRLLSSCTLRKPATM